VTKLLGENAGTFSVRVPVKWLPVMLTRFFPRCRPVLLVGLFVVGLAPPGWGCSSACAQEGRRRNQLGDLLRQLDKGIREGAEEIKNSKSARDQLDVRPVQRPEDHRRFQQVKDLIRQKKWNNAVEVLQFLVEQPSDAFSVSDAHEFRSLQNEVDQLIAGLPPEGRRNYENRYGVAAQQKLDAALNNQDEARLIEISSHYFHTVAGRRALALLARKWQDQGQFGRAAAAWLRLYRTADEEEKFAFGRSAARALSLAGRSTEATDIARTLPDSEGLLRQLQQVLPPDSKLLAPRGPYLQFTGTDDSVQKAAPTLLPRWTAALVERFNALQQIDLLKTELQELGRTLIPTLQPLAVQGKLVIRTLRSLQVRNAATGTLLWERRMERSPEELLTTSDWENELGMSEFRFSSDSLVEQHPLASLLYRDQVYGSMSSDGARLFAVESSGEAVLSAPLHLWQLQMRGSAIRTPWETNELTAYDLETGLVRWRVGGIAIEKEFSRPLAGTRFFSAPTPDGPELYVLGERQGEILLFCLSTQSGEPLWEQPLATPGRPIREDLIRSHWVCQPVLADGLILCPTTCGWLVAVDQVNHRLRWSARYAPRLAQQDRFRSGYSAQPLQELNRRWEAVVTLVSRGKVVVTPPELPDELGMSQPMLFCLDVQTGKTLWEQPKAERSGGMGLYLAGIWNECAVIVGTHNLVGRSLENSGEILWSVALPDRPTGRGIIVGDHLLLPVRGTRLLKIDLKSSTIEKTLLPAVEGELGNLELHQGQIISTNYQSIVALPADPENMPTDPDPNLLVRSRLGESKLLLAEKQFEKLESTLADLLKTPSLSSELRLEILDTQRRLLQQQLQTLPTDADALLSRLEQLSQTPRELRDFQRIRADHWLEAGHHQQALTAFLEILQEFPATERIEEGTLSVRIDGWVSGRLQQLFEAVSDAGERESLHAEIQSRVQAIRQKSSDPVVLDRWARALAFDKSGLQLELELADVEFQRGARSAGLLRLVRVTESENQILRTPALAQLATRLTELGWHEDALAAWTQLQQRPEETLAGEKTTKELAASGMAAAHEALRQQSAPSAGWGAHWTLERVGVSGNERNLQSIPLVGKGFHSAANVRLIQEADNSRVRLEDRRTGQSLNSFPLRSTAALEHHPSMGARLMASTIYIVHGGILHALGWPDQQMLWNWNSDVHGLALARMALVQPNLHFGLQSVQQFAATRQLRATRSQTGYLQAVTPRALLVHCKDWVALDPLTGEELWRDRSVSERGSAQEMGADWLILSNRSGQTVRSAISGHPRSARPPYESTNRPILITGNDFILLNRIVHTSGKNAVHDLQRMTAAGRSVWKMEIPADALLGLPDSNSLLMLRNSIELSLVDLTQGKTIKLGDISRFVNNSQGPLDPRNGLSVLSDEERLYVFINNKNVRPVYVNLPAIRLAGTIIAFSRQGERLWEYQTPEIPPLKSTKKSGANTEPTPWALNVLVQGFQDSPLLLLAGDDERQDPEVLLQFHQIRVIGLEKKTGKPLVDWERPSESGGFSYLYVDTPQQSIDLRTYNERLQLVSEPASSPSSSGSPP